MRIKICCIQSKEEADLATSLGADMLGLVGAMPNGPGPIPDAQISLIAGGLPPGVSSVLLSSETSAEGLVAHVRKCRPQVLQIVDTPASEAYAALKAVFPALKLMQVVHVEGEGALARARDVAAHVDAILLDSGRTGGAVKELGGTGRTHDWRVSARIVEAVDRPVFLAGGLTPDNVAEAVRAVRPFGVDLCTGVRTKGQLDRVKLTAFIKAARTS